MTVVYFIRHAQADTSVLDQQSRPLTEKGMQDCASITKAFTDKKIDSIFSSPYKRTLDTVAGIALQHKLSINIIDDLRGLRIQSNWIESYRSFFWQYWNDFDYHYADGESFAELQNRSIALIQKIIRENKDKTILISTHSVSMAVMLKYYNSSFSFEDFMVIADTEPYLIKLVFDEDNLYAFNDTVTEVL